MTDIIVFAPILNPKDPSFERFTGKCWYQCEAGAFKVKESKARY